MIVEMVEYVVVGSRVAPREQPRFAQRRSSTRAECLTHSLAGSYTATWLFLFLLSDHDV